MFNSDKCKWLHLGRGNPDLINKMGYVGIRTPRKDKDVRLILSINLEEYEHCGIAALKGNRILELIKRNVVNKEDIFSD